MGGGFYAGRIMIDGKAFALIASPKAEGETEKEWISDYQDVPGAKSYNDGLANTIAMAEAGSELAQWARDLRIADHDDWYIPSQDELEIIYRNLKPTARENSQYGRAGINVSAIEPTRPYTPELPAQTQAEAFQEGGDEAFETEWYWTSTQHASDSNYAWIQYLDNGNQTNYFKTNEFRARAVRRLAI
ncbi:DUF1566 domain-containing protein [Chitinibacter bivalviorum]|uniref:DUF1566 domain-containing protein n=2 Tax=Chitinibacter bivalviorum TaxID=2739434 RepID=A0A7H9BMH2_9NEIS|nr:DUF1566 domain-containing protein [Chitinibacter bivalviorum]